MRHKGRASFLAARHAAPVQEQKQEQGKFRNRKNSGTGVVCASTVDEPFATSFSLVGPRPCPRRPTAFRFLLTTTNPDWQKGTAPQPPRPFPGFPRTAPRLAATALVCASPESTQTHATSRMGRRREREEEKKRTDSAPRPRVDRWTSSHPHLTGVDHTEDVPHLHEPPVDLVRPNHRHRGRLGMQGTDPPPPLHGERASIRLPLFPSQHASATSPTGTGTGPWTSPSPSPLGPLFVMSWSRKPQPPACLCL